VLHRDLKQTNLLLDKNGVLKLCDFGLAKMLTFKEEDELSGRTYTLCGSPEYAPPEMIKKEGYGKSVDWWAIGILVHEMLAGYPPFFDDEPKAIYTQILRGSFTSPTHFDPNADGLIRKLLHENTARRLGCFGQGAEDIKKHKWFRGLNWAEVYNKRVEPPFVPGLIGPDDVALFDKYPDSVEESGPQLEAKKNAAFATWPGPK